MTFQPLNRASLHWSVGGGLASTVASADETTVQVLDEPGKDASSKSYMWVYRSGVFNAQPVVVYDYQPGRSHEYPKQFLQGFSGALQCDGYQAYDNIEHVTPVAFRVDEDITALTPHRPGRAQLTHPVLHNSLFAA